MLFFLKNSDKDVIHALCFSQARTKDVAIEVTLIKKLMKIESEEVLSSVKTTKMEVEWR